MLTDGMGGLDHGRTASQRSVKAFVSYYEDKTSEESIPDALLRATRQTNQELNAWKDANHITAQVGTTLAACVVHNDVLYWISVGDSSIYAYRDQQLVLLTEPHVFAEDLEIQVKLGEITESAARAHVDKDALTSYLGLGDLKHVDRNIKPYRLFAGQKVLLCSDGLDKTLSEEEISVEMRGSAPALCERLVQKALEKNVNSQDNITVMALDCIDSKDFAIGPAPASAAEMARQTSGAKKKPRVLSLAMLALLLVSFLVWRYFAKPSSEHEGPGDAKVVSPSDPEAAPSEDLRPKPAQTPAPEDDGTKEQAKEGVDASPKVNQPAAKQGSR